MYISVHVCVCMLCGGVYTCVCISVSVHVCVLGGLCLCACMHTMQEVSVNTGKGSSGLGFGQKSKLWRDSGRNFTALSWPLNGLLIFFFFFLVAASFFSLQEPQRRPDGTWPSYRVSQQAELGPMVEDPQKPIRLHSKEASDSGSRDRTP